MALGENHAKLSFSGWRIPLVASPALLIQENLDLLIAITFQRHEEAVHNVEKGCQKQNRNIQKRRLSRMLLSSSIFDVFWTDFDAKGTRHVHEIIRKTQRF